MRSLIFVITICLLSVCGLSQEYDPLHPPNTFKNQDNPNYWKNKMPHEGYWQQDVHYTIKASIDETTDIIEGEEKLVYWNNSPDDLDVVYFHLYQNAFQPDSYYDNLQKNNNKKPVYGKYESQKKGTEILTLKVNGRETEMELDNTVLKVYLPETLKSGEKITFDIQFKTYFDNAGNVRRRMKKYRAFGHTHYNGVHWYPRISVYDRKFGWTTDQHLGREFYGDFGTFDVELTFASNYVVGATGFLQNRDEVLPADLREKLDIKNFADKPWNSPPSEIIPYNPEERKTWVYHAENVHDFAFTADPTYRIGEAEWNGKTCYALAQEPHAAGWQNAAEYTAKVIQLYSEDIGMYTYHKMIVADARDGMEYPMLTLDGGSDPGYRGLLAHEVGHNWFFGQVGNNETYRAFMDEGFTQFLTAWSHQHIENDTIPQKKSKSWYKNYFREPTLGRYRSAYYGYLADAVKAKDAHLNTHSDGFGGALRHGGGYRHVYYKMATMLYNLQYVLGDSLFLEAMQHYFQQWKIAHPYPEDFRRSIIQYTDIDLVWFFDQWLETTKRIDYGIKSVKKGKEENEYKITFRRKGRMQMPLDFRVIDKNGEKHDFHIPNTWFEKATEATVLPKWTGWDKLHPTYQASVTIPGGVKEVIIDPSHRLADVYMLDNSSKLPVEVKFDSRIYNMPDWRNYEVFTRPEIWYNSIDGIQPGFHMHGNYMKYLHKFDLTLWFSSGIGRHNWGDSLLTNSFNYASYRFSYETALDRFIKGSSVSLSAQYIAGLHQYQLGFDKKSNSENSRVYTYFKSLYRPNVQSLFYPLYPSGWNLEEINNTINVGLDHHYRYVRGKGDINVNLRSSSLGSDYDYANITLTAINDNKLGKIRLKTRTFVQYGFGTRWAPESELYLAGASPEELADNKYTRARGFVPNDWTGYDTTLNHFHMGGGLNLRGYAGYFVPYEDEDGNIRAVYKGSSGAAFNAELEFNRLIGFNPRFLRNTFDLRTYLFGDIGVINANTIFENPKFAEVRADAGIGAALTIQRWGPLEMVNPLTIRFDMPLFLNRIPAHEDNFVDFRWVVGVSRAF